MSSSMYYIAVVAPRSINEKILEWKYFMQERFGCVAALKSPAHVTLAPPFWMKSDVQPQLENALATFCRDKKDFSLQLRNFGHFKPRVIFAQVERCELLAKFKDELENYLLLSPLFPIKKETRSFHAHITIASRDLHKKDFDVAWDYFKNKKYHESFPVSSVSLLKHNGVFWEEAYKAGFCLM